MTVVVGFVGTDGAVMASDSQASELDKTKHQIEKLWICQGLLMGYSGNTAVRDPLMLSLDEALAKTDVHASRWKVIAEVVAASKPVLAGMYANYVPAPPQGQIPASLAGVLLLIGRDPDGYWLADVDHNNTPTFHTERNFHAVGSGSVAAQVANGLLEHYEPKGRTVKDLRLVAYRTVATCIKVVDVGVGGEVQLWSAEGDDEFAKLEVVDLEVVKAGVERWETIERDSLKQAFEAGDEQDKAPVNQIPAPLAEPAEPPPKP